jgi:anthranilate synthase/aminodeoxychorismate synthase-like glutamine amidotransferase
MILMIDNYDSFTYNLVQYLGELGAKVKTVRNDAITTAQIRELNPEGIVISPGPCTPDDAGISLAVVAELGESYPILGVCLGHQCIGQVFGGRVVRADKIMHGKTSMMHPPRACVPVCQIRLTRPAITRWCCEKMPYPGVLKPPPGLRQKTVNWKR